MSENSFQKTEKIDEVLLIKGYFPNLLETESLHQIFVFRVRDFKFWQPAFFQTVQSFSKIGQH
jgi:hypothetical protein